MIGAEGAIAFEALENQAADIMNLFVEKGYERVAPSFIQPAGLFLDRIGETIRSRTYVFTDPNGEELCLRPDLTVPVCRIFLERPPATLPARFCYNGPAFRMQEGKPDPLRPREFRQAGIECIGSSERETDHDVLAATLEAVQRAGLRRFIVRLGHIGIFSKLIHSLPMPDRWRERLIRAFWRQHAFNAELKRLSAPRRQQHRNHGLKFKTADEDAFIAYLDDESMSAFGNRSVDEVLQRLRDQDADENETPLTSDVKATIDHYLDIEGESGATVNQISEFGHRHNVDVGPLVDEIANLTALADRVAPNSRVVFGSDFGRHFEYYTGAVFQIEVEGGGLLGQVAGGGRYDGLIGALSGGTHNVPAVGAAIHTERLLMNVASQR